MSDQQAQQPTILFMARDPDDRYSLKYLLEKEGYQVFGRQTRERAAQLMSVYSLDLILIDLDLHESTGIEYCHYLRKTNYARVVPIMLIGDDDEHGTNCVAAYEAGADDFVPTPFVFGVCLAKIRYHLKGRFRSQVVASSMSVVVSAGELPGVLQFLEVEQKTGQLTIKSTPGTAVLTIKEGKLINAHAPNVEGRETVTEVLCWDSSSVVFTDVEPSEEDHQFDDSLTRVIMNSAVQVDEYRALQKKLPPQSAVFLQGDKRLPDDAASVQRDLHHKAVLGHGRDELLQDHNYTERQATVALLELIDDGYLKVGEAPYHDYAARSFSSYVGKDGSNLRLLLKSLRALQFPLKQLSNETAPISIDWTTPVPVIIVTGNKPEHGHLLINSILQIHRSMTGRNPAIRKHLGGTTTYRLSPDEHHCVDIIHLPAELNPAILRWLDPQVPYMAGILLIVSDQDRYNIHINLRLMRLLRQRFQGVAYHLVPRVMDGDVAIFKMDCEKCGYKLAVDIDGVGDTGICPICNAEIIMPDCLDNLARVMRLPREVPIVQAQPDDVRHAHDLLCLLLDTIIYSMDHPEKAEQDEAKASSTVAKA